MKQLRHASVLAPGHVRDQLASLADDRLALKKVDPVLFASVWWSACQADGLVWDNFVSRTTCKCRMVANRTSKTKET